MRSLFIFCLLLSCHHPKEETTPKTAPPETQPSAPSTPNRFDSLSWPEVTTSDKLYFSSRVAPSLMDASEEQKIQLSMLSEATPERSLEPFLQTKLPEKSEVEYKERATDLPGLAKSALWYGPGSTQWGALEERLSLEKKTLQRQPLSPPGEIEVQEKAIKIRFELSLGFEWSSYLLCKALLRGDSEIRVNFLGEALDEYHWTTGEEELCLWALEGAREHLRTQASMGKAPSADLSLARLDQAAQGGHMLGFVLVEFLLPRRGSLMGISNAELDAAALYLLSEALIK